MSVDTPSVALVYMPFGGWEQPAFGLSLLKAALAEHGFGCDIHYLNLLLASELGAQSYAAVTEGLPTSSLVSDWLFSAALCGENSAADRDYVNEVLWGEYRDRFPPRVVHLLMQMRARMPGFLHRCLDEVDWSRYDVVGFSASYYQNCASLALARLIKQHSPTVRIIFGGASCNGEIGLGLLRVFPFIDAVCLGEGDIAFPSWVDALANGDGDPHVPGIASRTSLADAAQTLQPAVVDDLDALPYADFSDYFAQSQRISFQMGTAAAIPVETTRGCWWGQHTPCTFCSFLGSVCVYRKKSPQRILDEIAHLRQNFVGLIRVMDNAIEPRYFRTLLPALAEQAEDLSMFWELRANLSREQIALLATAGIRLSHIGIESLSDQALGLMNKGTSSLQNIQALKWSKQYGITASWNLLFGFPGEDASAYEAVLALIPLLQHLNPPNVAQHVRVERFNAYYRNPEAFGITQVAPARAYRFIYHSLSADELREFAYIFDAEYDDVSADYGRQLQDAVNAWRQRDDAVLDVYPHAQGIRIIDTRTPGERREYHFDGLAAQLYLQCDVACTLTKLLEVPGDGEPSTAAEVEAILSRFVDLGLMIHRRDRYLSLAVLRAPETSAQQAESAADAVSCGCTGTRARGSVSDCSCGCEVEDC